MSESNPTNVGPTTDEPPRMDLGRVWSGLVFVAMGVWVWLRWDNGIALVDLATYWPLLLIISGISGMLSERACSGGLVLTAVGVGLLLFNLGYAPWPALLVGVGIVMVLRGLREGSRLAKPGDGHA